MIKNAALFSRHITRTGILFFTPLLSRAGITPLYISDRGTSTIGPGYAFSDETWFIRLSCLVLLLVCAAAIYKVRSNHRVAHNKNLRRPETSSSGQPADVADEPRATIETLRESRNELLKRVKQNEMFLTVLGHDIRGPLRFAAETTTRMLAKWDVLDEKEKKEYMELIKINTVSLDMFISDFLTWMKMKTDPVTTRGQAMHSVGQMVEDVLIFIRDTGVTKNNRVMSTIAGDLQITIEKPIFEIILRNIVENACKATRGGEIIVSAEQNDDQLLITCKDNGIGMSAEQLSKILKMGDQDDIAGDESFKMGYRFIMHLAQRINAEVRISSIPGEGTSVTIAIKLDATAAAH